jgi:hypothetical protein
MQHSDRAILMGFFSPTSELDWNLDPLIYPGFINSVRGRLNERKSERKGHAREPEKPSVLNGLQRKKPIIDILKRNGRYPARERQGGAPPIRPAAASAAQPAGDTRSLAPATGPCVLGTDGLALVGPEAGSLSGWHHDVFVFLYHLA